MHNIAIISGNDAFTVIVINLVSMKLKVLMSVSRIHCPQVPYEVHVIQEPATGKGGIGDLICNQAEDLQAAAVVRG